MIKYMTLKYATLLLILVCLFGFVHCLAIGPFLSCFIMDTELSQMTQTICLFIIEPVICVLTMVYFINRKETQLYDSIS